MSDGPPRSSTQIDVTTWSDVGSRDALALVAASVAEMVGFEIAMISHVQGDRMFTVAVEGTNEAVDAMLGLTTPLASVLPELDRADDWGRFRFVPHDRLPSDENDIGWVPDFEPIDAPDAWHPLDLLIAPLYGEDGVLIGMLSIDVPLSGRIPGTAQRHLLGRYAAQAERALRMAAERDELAQRIRLAEAARRVVRFATSQDDLESVLDDCRHPLMEGFRADFVTIRSYASEEFAAAGTPSVDATAHTVAAVQDVVLACWERQEVAVVSAVNDEPGLDDDTHATLHELAASVGVATTMIVPFGAGTQCLGHVILGRKDPTLRWSPDEQAGALDVARDIGQAVVNARNLSREQRLVGELRQLATYKSQVLSTVSHELKNPLSAVLGYVEILDGDTTLSPETRRSITALDRAARRMSRVVDDLLLLAEVEDPEGAVATEPIDARPIVEEAIELVRVTAARRELTVRFASPDREVPVCCEPADLDRVLTNLLSNAVKYTPRGGTITLSLRERGDEVELVVADEGIGISEADQARLFTEFFRSTNPQAVAQPGTGLGLTICARIVERHGGRMAVESALGVGSTFRVFLPRPS